MTVMALIVPWRDKAFCKAFCVLGISKADTATELRAGKLEAERKSLRAGTEVGLGVQGSSQGGGASIPRCFCSQQPGAGGGNVTTGDQHLTKQRLFVYFSIMNLEI